MRAELFFFAEKYVDAEKELQGLLEQLPEYTDAKVLLSRVLIKEGKIKEAIGVVEKLPTHVYGDIDGILIEALAKEGKWSLAADILAVKIAQTPPEKQLYSNSVSLVGAYTKAGRKEDALAELEQMKVRFPEKIKEIELQIEAINKGVLKVE